MADGPVLLLKMVNENKFLIDWEVPPGDHAGGPYSISRQDLVNEVVFPSNPELGWKRIILTRCSRARK